MTPHTSNIYRLSDNERLALVEMLIKLASKELHKYAEADEIQISDWVSEHQATRNELWRMYYKWQNIKDPEIIKYIKTNIFREKYE
jgi:adenosyl cobinamide kinase/adenosyl cobinamide phosphate guanylyltransferase